MATALLQQRAGFGDGNTDSRIKKIENDLKKKKQHSAIKSHGGAQVPSYVQEKNQARFERTP